MTLSFDNVADILAAIDGHSGSQVAIEIAGGTLTVTRWSDAATSTEGRAASLRHESAPIPSEARVIQAPTLGLIRRSPEPGAPAFVEAGSRVAAGQTLCTIDVLGRSTTVAAASSGRITEIAAADDTLVEYGQHLFTLLPDA